MFKRKNYHTMLVDYIFETQYKLLFDDFKQSSKASILDNIENNKEIAIKMEKIISKTKTSVIKRLYTRISRSISAKEAKAIYNMMKQNWYDKLSKVMIILGSEFAGIANNLLMELSEILAENTDEDILHETVNKRKAKLAADLESMVKHQDLANNAEHN